MNEGYFHRVSALTPTRFWINNVTREEAALAIEAGATGCTQNPSYVWKMLTHPTESAHARELLKDVLRDTADDNEAECALQRRLVGGIAEIFLPLWEASRGREGYVSIQGDPVHEHDPRVIIEEGRKSRAMGPNVMVKIPATRAGLAAMEVLLAESTPINATEVMGVAQALAVMELYEKVARGTGLCPPSYISHIAGIYDEYLEDWARRNEVEVPRDYLFQAGLAVARKVYCLMKETGSRMGFIGGGVRGLHHFTELVGGEVCLTINWKGTADALLELDPPVVSRIHNPVSVRVLDALLAGVPEFRRGYMEGGLGVDEFEDFGPVELFRSKFLEAWNGSLELIKEARKALAAGAGTRQPAAGGAGRAGGGEI